MTLPIDIWLNLRDTIQKDAQIVLDMNLTMRLDLTIHDGGIKGSAQLIATKVTPRAICQETPVEKPSDTE